MYIYIYIYIYIYVYIYIPYRVAEDILHVKLRPTYKLGESNRIRTVPEYRHYRYLRNHKS